MRTPARRPYWLLGGTESCHACSHFYVYPMEYRCAACDRGICCHCVRIAVVTGEALCPQCAAEGGED
jgi:hypothetical protein